MNCKSPLLLLIFCFLCLAPNYAQETVFDRKESLKPYVQDIPVVPRYEERLHLKGRYELVDDVNLWVEQSGSGAPLVLVSGGPGTSHHYFHPHFEQAAKFCQIVFYDLRGVGLSDRHPGVDGYSIDQAVDDLDRLRAKLGYDRWTVLGLSFGGAIAQLYALKYPERLSGMILLSAVLPMSLDIGLGSRQYDFMSEAERNRIAQIYSIGGKRTPPVHTDLVSPELQRNMLYNAFINGDWKRRHLKKWTEEDIAMYVRYEFVHDKGYYRAMFNDYFEYDLKGLFKTCPIPTLIIEGKWDLAYSSEKAQIMFDQFPKAKSEYWESAGHLVFEDEPYLFMQTIANFLQNLPAPDDQQVTQWKNSFSPAQYRIPNEVQRGYLRRR